MFKGVERHPRKACIAVMQIATPYKGALPYLEEDSDFFFARDAEIELVCDVFRTAKLTLLLGAEGIGKTSLLRAGVVPHLKRSAEEPERIIVFESRRDDPIARFTRTLRHAYQERLPNFLSLDSIVKTITTDAKLLIVLDHFEECVLRHKAFAAEFTRLANESNVHFLLSVRDDAETELHAQHAELVFDSTLRLQPLTLDAARAAIVNPVEVFNSRNPGLEMRIEPEVIDGILEAAKHDAAHIDAGRLQRIAAALWAWEFQSGANTMRANSLNAILAGEKDTQRSAPKDDPIFDDPHLPPLVLHPQVPIPVVEELVQRPAADENMRRLHRVPVYAAIAVVLIAAAVLWFQTEPETKVLARIDDAPSPSALAPPSEAAPQNATPSPPPSASTAALEPKITSSEPATISSSPPATKSPPVAPPAAVPRSPSTSAATPPSPRAASASSNAVASAEPEQSPSVFIHVREKSDAALKLARQLAQGGISVSGVKQVERGPRIIDLRYFRPQEKKEANEIANRLKRFDIRIAEVKYIKGYEDTARDRQYELWFPAEALH
jgi:hypothetical protein